MNIVIFVIIGFVLGAAALYLMQMKDLDRLDEAESELKKSRRALIEAEADHETRLKEAIAEVQTDYQHKRELEVQSLTLDFNEKIQVLKAKLREVAHAEEIPQIDFITPTPSSTTSQSFAPPKLAADIQSLEEPPELKISIPTGKKIDPPIMAQSLQEEDNAEVSAIAPETSQSDEPPILAAEINYGESAPESTMTEPSGKKIDPPIQAQ